MSELANDGFAMLRAEKALPPVKSDKGEAKSKRVDEEEGKGGEMRKARGKGGRRKGGKGGRRRQRRENNANLND